MHVIIEFWLGEIANEEGTTVTRAFAPLTSIGASNPAPTVEQFTDIPDEEIWLRQYKNARTRSAYRRDVQHFFRTLMIATATELCVVDHHAIIAWERFMREVDHAATSTIRRRLASVSSLFTHLIRQGHVGINPVDEVERPTIDQGPIPRVAFSRAQANKLLEAPPENTVAGLRDRAILSLGLHYGLRRSEIVALKISDLQNSRGDPLLRTSRKGSHQDVIVISSAVAARLHAYLNAVGNHGNGDVPLFRPLKHNGKSQDKYRRLHPDVVDRIVRKYGTKIGLDGMSQKGSVRGVFLAGIIGTGAGHDKPSVHLSEGSAKSQQHGDRRLPRSGSDIESCDGEGRGAWVTDYLTLAYDLRGRRPGTDGRAASITAAEIVNIGAAMLASAAVPGGTDAAVAAVEGYTRVLRYKGQSADTVLLLLRNRCIATNNRIGEAICLLGMAGTARMRAEHEKASKFYADAQALYQDIGDLGGQADCFWGLADIARVREQVDEAIERYNAARVLYQRVDRPNGEANCLWGLANIFRSRRNYETAKELYTAAGSLFRLGSGTAGEADCFSGMAWLAVEQDERDKARDFFVAARTLYQRVGWLGGEANCVSGLAHVAWLQAKYGRAAELYEVARALHHRCGAITGEADCLLGLANIARVSAEYAKAGELYETARELYRRVGGASGEADSLYSLAVIARTREEDDHARELYHASRALYRRTGELIGEAHCLWGLAEMSWFGDDYDTARKLYIKARLLYRRAGWISGEVNSLWRLAGIARALDDYDQERKFYERACELSRQENGADESITHRRIVSEHSAIDYRSAKQYPKRKI